MAPNLYKANWSRSLFNKLLTSPVIIDFTGNGGESFPYLILSKVSICSILIVSLQSVQSLILSEFVGLIMRREFALNLKIKPGVLVKFTPIY